MELVLSCSEASSLTLKSWKPGKLEKGRSWSDHGPSHFEEKVYSSKDLKAVALLKGSDEGCVAAAERRLDLDLTWLLLCQSDRSL